MTTTEPEIGQANHDGVAIHFEVIGDGPPLVLQHGRLGSGRFWFDAGYVRAMAGEHRLVVVDARGHGRSDKPTDPSAYRPEAMAGDIVAVLDELAIERADLFGYSMGGRIGFATATHFGARIHALVSGGAGPYGQARSAEAERELADTLAGGMEAYLTSMERMLERTIPAPDRERLLANDAEALAALATATADWPPMVDALVDRVEPMLLFGGTGDPIWPLIERAAAAFPTAELRAVGPFGHGEDLRRPDLVLPIVTDFLRTNGLAATSGS
ncbi:MAG: alpha/beta fold hydrolase [Actinomycetota bacterium]